MSRFNPPAPAVLAPIIRIVCQTQTKGQLCQMAFDYVGSVPGNLSVADLTAFESSWRTLTLTDMKAVLTADTTFVSNIVSELHYGVTPSYTFVHGAGVVGTVAGNSLPLEMAALLQKTSGLKGQHGRGRTFVPAVPISFTTPATDPNLLNAGAVTAYNTLTADLFFSIAVGANTFTPSILTRPTPPNTLFDNAIAIAHWQTIQLLATARRRKPGRGQ